MAGVKLRVTTGVGAWVLGATAATSLSLFAVSHLATVMAGAQGSALSPDDVSHALTSAATGPTTPSASASPAPSPSASESAGQGSEFSGPAAAGAAANGATTNPTASNSSPTSSSPQGSSSSSAPSNSKRRLSGHGGQVVAQCQGHLAYLVSWSPAQGFHVGPVQRGPARVVSVVFIDDSAPQPLEMEVYCLNGVPTVSGDDGWHDH